MALRKCPKCELNYIKDDQSMCDVCAKALKSAVFMDDADICPNCGERTVASGKEFCSVCLAEFKRLAKEASSKGMDEPSMLPVETPADDIVEMEDVELEDDDETPFDIEQEIDEDMAEEDADEAQEVSLDAMALEEDFDEDEDDEE